MKPTRHVGTRRSLAIAATGATIAMIASGCSAQTGTQEDSFTYWSQYAPTETQAKVLGEAIDAFEKDTGITVDVQWLGRGNLTQVTAALNTNDVPDLIDQASPQVEAILASNGSAADLTSVYDSRIPGEDGTVGEAIPEKYLPFVSQDGKPFMVPFTVQASAVWYDSATLSDVAATPPASWSEFTDLLQAEADAGRSPLALDADVLNYDHTFVAGVLARALGPGGYHDLLADESGDAWDDPKVLDGLQKVQDLVSAGYFIPGYDGSKWPAIQQKWAGGEADFIYMGSWLPNEVHTSVGPEFTFGAMPLPAFEAGDPTPIPVALNGFSVLEKGKNKENAEKFISYFLSQENQAKLAETAGNLPVRQDVTPPAALTDVAKLLADNDVYASNDNVDGDFPDLVTKTMQPLAQKLLTGKTDAAQYVNDAKAQQIQYWKLAG